VGFIKTINPKPGAAFYSGGRTNYIHPDIIVVKNDESFDVLIGDYDLPEIHISAYYRRLSEQSEDPELTCYLEEKLRQAKWLIKCIEQRKSTLRKCAEAIVAAQERFFRAASDGLASLSMKDLAEKIGVNESTLSRAIRGKYLQCSHGIYPLQFFFSRKLGQCEVSADKAKRLLKGLIDAENKLEPLSDQKIAEHFKGFGIVIARRTVAKYRTEMNMPNTSGRRAKGAEY
jgi:RNA polymerase sigma-54 factor